MRKMNNKSSQSQTKILREYNFLGRHHVDTNKGKFVLEYRNVKPTAIDTKPQVEVTFRHEGGKIYSVVNWNSKRYLSQEIIINTIK